MIKIPLRYYSIKEKDLPSIILEERS